MKARHLEVDMPKAQPELPGRHADEDALWEFVDSRRMDRRQFLRLMMAGGVTAVLFACNGGEHAGTGERCTWTTPRAIPSTSTGGVTS